jgi:hypothetical protein
MACCNMCERVAVKAGGRAMPYSMGLKYCSRCSVYLDSDSTICFCCGIRLRCRGLYGRSVRKVHRY